MSPPSLTVVVPFFDEQENVDPLILELLPVLEATGRAFEVIAVDDGSTDGTQDRLRALAAHPGLRVLCLARNTGQTAALAAGFRAARGDLVATMDGDLQVDPRDLPAMIRILEDQGVDLVYGWRKDRRDPFLRRASTLVANAIRNRLTGERIHDTGCPLKLFRWDVLADMPLFTGMHRFLVTLAHIQGWRSAEMIVHHRPRRAGHSKYGVWNRVFRSFRDCLAVRWMQSRWPRVEVQEIGKQAAWPSSRSPVSHATEDGSA
jgi:glycosyltransferase involved in cell wall biosynthesis